MSGDGFSIPADRLAQLDASLAAYDDQLSRIVSSYRENQAVTDRAKSVALLSVTILATFRDAVESEDGDINQGITWFADLLAVAFDRLMRCPGGDERPGVELCL